MPRNLNHPYPKIVDAIEQGDVERLDLLLKSHPEMREFVVPGTGGTWLHHAAAYGTLDTLSYLLDLGFDLNSTQQRDNSTPLDAAAGAGRADNVAYLLSRGAVLDTSSSSTNPLFAAILGKSSEVVGLLLDHGVDATVRYTENWENMDAVAFALTWGEIEIADLVAEHLARGDLERKRLLLDEASAVADANVEPVPAHGGCPDLSE